MAKRDEAGFTLLELTVVVLILGVLLSVAIPVFTSLAGAARSRGAEANLTTALTDETTYYLQYGAYGTTTSTPTIASFDGGLNWSACTGACITDAGTGKIVYVDVLSGNAGVILGAAGSDGKDYWEYQSSSVTYTGPSPAYVVGASLASPPALASFTKSTWTSAGG